MPVYKFKGTPGAWKTTRESAIDYRPMQVVTADGKTRVATCDGGGPVRAVDGPEERANATAIAQVPAMIDALRPFADLAEYRTRMVQICNELSREEKAAFIAAVDAAAEVLARACGV